MPVKANQWNLAASDNDRGFYLASAGGEKRIQISVKDAARADWSNPLSTADQLLRSVASPAELESFLTLFDIMNRHAEMTEQTRSMRDLCRKVLKSELQRTAEIIRLRGIVKELVDAVTGGRAIVATDVDNYKSTTAREFGEEIVLRMDGALKSAATV